MFSSSPTRTPGLKGPGRANPAERPPGSGFRAKGPRAAGNAPLVLPSRKRSSHTGRQNLWLCLSEDRTTSHRRAIPIPAPGRVKESSTARSRPYKRCHREAGRVDAPRGPAPSGRKLPRPGTARHGCFEVQKGELPTGIEQRQLLTKRLRRLGCGCRACNTDRAGVTQ